MARPADLTLDQKVALLAGADTWHTLALVDPGVPAIRMTDGPAGARGTSWSGPASASFPCGSALGATWSPDLVREVGRALGREARAKGADVLLAPTVNLHRTPIGGRNFEFPSEDPLLAAAYAVAYVEGVQQEGVACCIKHFVANETERERMTVSSEVDERTLREVYLVPFEAAVRRAGVRAVMSAYNRLNGTYCADHRWLLTDVLRDEWGFDGVVISDWFGNHSTVESLRAGLDLEMPGPPIHRGDRLRAAVAAGEVDLDVVDAAVERVLSLAAWTGAGTHPTDEVTRHDPRTDDVIRRAAIAGTVLLRNESAALPLPGPDAGTIALIGPYARFGRVQGGGSARVTPTDAPGPHDALVARGYRVVVEPGDTIARFLPAVRGDFELELTGDGGALVRQAVGRLHWYWDDPPVANERGFTARVHGTFRPPHTGDFELGVRAVGPVRVALDGTVVLELADPELGGSFFGMGSTEHRTPVALAEGQSHELVVELGAMDGALVRALAVGLAPVPDPGARDAAAAAASAAGAAVVIVGTDDDWETEGEDRAGLALPGRQDELVAAVAQANPRTIVVVNAGSPVAMPWLDQVAAVVQLWFPGQALGDALSDILTGAAEPGGRLPLTFPRRLEDTPAWTCDPGELGRTHYGERLHVGHRWYDRHDIEPLFPFGFGLGYTTWALTPVDVVGSADGGATVTVDATNTGERAGTTVVQVYVEPPAGDPDRPVRHLGGFGRVAAEPGATERVTIDLPTRSFATWDGGWVVRPGDHELSVGLHSRDRVVAGRVPGGR